MTTTTMMIIIIMLLVLLCVLIVVVVLDYYNTRAGKAIADVHNPAKVTILDTMHNHRLIGSGCGLL